MPEVSRMGGEPARYGAWYISLAGRVLRAAGPSWEDKEKKIQAAKRNFESAEVAANEAFDAMSEARLRGGQNTSDFRAAETRYKAVKARLERAGAVYRQDKFRSAIDFLGWNLDEFDVMAFAQIMAMIVFALCAIATMPVFIIRWFFPPVHHSVYFHHAHRDAGIHRTIPREPGAEGSRTKPGKSPRGHKLHDYVHEAVADPGQGNRIYWQSCR